MIWVKLRRLRNILSIYGNKGGSLSATYDENGKLIRVVEEYKDISYPLLYTVYKAYLDGKLLTTSIYIHRRWRRLKKHNLKLKNGDIN
jgi:hypothetical protein